MPTELLPNIQEVRTPGDTHDPIANHARQATARVLQAVAKLPSAGRAAAVKMLADQLRPGGGDWLNAQTKQQLRMGSSPGDALSAGLSALIANQYVTMLAAGKLPAWWHTGVGDLGGIGDTLLGLVKDAGKAVVCTEGTGKLAGSLVRSGDTGAAVGDKGQAVLQNMIGCAPSGGGDGGYVPVETGPLGISWTWWGIGTAGVVVLGVGGYFLLRKKD